MAELDWIAARVPARAVRLSNGLTVVAHQDSKAPLAAVYVAYRAGSREEPELRSGLAHLCEHLMYTGTPSAPGSYFGPMEQVGATWINAHVKEDYSGYFATVPVWALDFALRMEADRMAHLADAIEDAKIDRQREVVRNELRQREGEPFGRATRIIAELAHPKAHTYAHPPDGIVEQLDNISGSDVREWIATRHGAASAAVIVAGDIEPDAAVENVRRHFEPVARGPQAVQSRSAHAGLEIDRARRGAVEEPGERSRLYMVWNGPVFAAPDAPAFDLACGIIAGGRNSRLWRRAVDADCAASEVAFRVRPRQLGSQMILSITARPGVPLDAIEPTVLDELERLAHSGASLRELGAARLRIFAQLVRGLQCVGGPNSKSEMLGAATMLGAGPQTHDERVAAIAAVGPGAVSAAAAKWLGVNCAVLEMRAAP